MQNENDINELIEYLEDNYFHLSNYGGIIFFHYKKCLDILIIDNNKIVIHSLPNELSNKEMPLGRNEQGDIVLNNKNDINKLISFLN
jgi:hypothetical protein